MSTPPSAAEPVVSVAKRIVSARDMEVAHYAQLYPLLLAEIGSIMAEWDRKTDELPWSQLEEDERRNNLSSVVTRVIDCAMSEESRDVRVNALIDSACAHGESRRKQGVDVPSLFTEYDVVRNATWKHLKTISTPPTSYNAIFVIDGLLSVASRGTVLGFHRKEMEANGLWDSQREELRKTVRS